jgi:hypothetical protein
MMNWKGHGKKRLWPNSRHYPGIRLEGLSKTKKAIRRTGLYLWLYIWVVFAGTPLRKFRTHAGTAFLNLSFLALV